MTGDVLILASGAIGGLLLGWLSARGTQYLLSSDGVPPPGLRTPLVPDLLVQGGSAAAALALLVAHGPSWKWVASTLLAVALVQVAVTDLRYRFVYVDVARAITVVAILLNPVTHGVSLFPRQLAALFDPFFPSAGPVLGAILVGLLGALGGLLAFLAIYLVGLRLYRGREPLARGDITIAALVGAVAGPDAAVALIAGVFFSGVFALAVLLVRRSREAYMPYGPGLCLGGLLALFPP